MGECFCFALATPNMVFISSNLFSLGNTLLSNDATMAHKPGINPEANDLMESDPTSSYCWWVAEKECYAERDAGHLAALCDDNEN